MEYKCWGSVSRDVCIYLEADNSQEAADKALAAFKRGDDGICCHSEHVDEDIAIQEKTDGEYGDEIIFIARGVE